ncbi:hypothetical protein [Jeotgalibacillus aurantiacus]|uniref:hypothetical protein n=1 Tax=Jeotgalibacillus aurantiacus TaxID=2763266 RepID=UPI001D0A36AD|nr:hypothetical protein [Jeotgalibacillus aurantiacus]
MKKIGKLFLASSLALGGLFSLGETVSVASSNPIDSLENMNVIEASELVKDKKIKNNNKNLEELNVEYNLKDVDLDNLEEGTNVYNFETEEDLQKFLEEIESTPKKVHKEIKLNDSNNDHKVSDDGEFSTMATSSVRPSTSENTGFSDVYLYADISVYSTGSFRQITGINKVWTEHNGVTFSQDWKETYAYGTVNSTKQLANIYGGGEFSYVLFIEGIGKLYTRKIDLSFTYYL